MTLIRLDGNMYVKKPILFNKLNLIQLKLLSVLLANAIDTASTKYVLDVSDFKEFIMDDGDFSSFINKLDDAANRLRVIRLNPIKNDYKFVKKVKMDRMAERLEVYLNDNAVSFLNSLSFRGTMYKLKDIIKEQNEDNIKMYEFVLKALNDNSEKFFIDLNEGKRLLNMDAGQPIGEYIERIVNALNSEIVLNRTGNLKTIVRRNGDYVLGIDVLISNENKTEESNSVSIQDSQIDVDKYVDEFFQDHKDLNVFANVGGNKFFVSENNEIVYFDGTTIVKATHKQIIKAFLTYYLNSKRD